MDIIYDSGLKSFAEDETQYIEIIHNLGKRPPIIQFIGEKNLEIGFPKLSKSTGEDIPGPYLTDILNPIKLKVFKPNAYTYNGQFRVRIYE